MRKHRPDSRGSALLATVVYLSALTVLSSAFLASFHRTYAEWRKIERNRQCMLIAESGIEKAIASILSDPAGYRGEEDTLLGTGRFSVEVQQGARRGVYQIVSTARLGQKENIHERVRVTVVIALSPTGGIAKLHWIEVKKW